MTDIGQGYGPSAALGLIVLILPNPRAHGPHLTPWFAGASTVDMKETKTTCPRYLPG
jgi:hypothetical protein